MTIEETVKLQPTEFQCEECQKIHTKNVYALAQLAMGNDLFFTCDCGNRIELQGDNNGN